MQDKIWALCGGNFGAVKVVADMVTRYPNALQLLEESGLRGANIWLACKDFGDGTYQTLYVNLTDPTFPDLVKTSPDYVKI
jgi:hypothetical protein